jgi:uncharacterized protein YbbC (DUF1343 family)
MRLGIDRLLAEGELRRPLQGRRVALLGHPASVNHVGRHSLDALMALGGLDMTAAFGPQHGMRGDKQDNMVESADYTDPLHGIPVFSLYGTVRYPTDAMLDTFDLLLVDLQDIGTRIYTYVTTLAYMLEACAKHGKAVWVLDRPNPAGRPIEGSILEPGWESFVGAGQLMMRHGLTLGELAQWFVKHKGLELELGVVAMEGYDPDAGPGYGWPRDEIPWVNPSPNAASLNMARCFPGTVLLEGTTLSEGRGTTVPLEVIGAPDIDISRAAQAHGVATVSMDARCLGAQLWLRADLPQASGPALSRHPDPHRQRSLSAPAIHALSADSPVPEGPASGISGLCHLARLPLRIRDRTSGHRPAQRRYLLARMGRRQRCRAR